MSARAQSTASAERGFRLVICGRSLFVSVRQGLRGSEGTAASQHPVQSLPLIVIRKCSRELASVLLLRQAQPPRLSRNDKPRLSFDHLPLVHLRQKPASCFPVSLSALSCVVASHGSNHRTGVRQGAEKRRQELVIQRQGPSHA